MNKISPRDDVLISICFSNLHIASDNFSKLKELRSEIESKFRFCEIILLIDAEFEEDFLKITNQISDIRLFSMSSSQDYYAQRVILAEEAIGDVVLITDLEEIKYINIFEMVNCALEEKATVIAENSVRNIVYTPFSKILSRLGKSAGFRVDLQNLHTMALLRPHLNYIIAHSTPELALRFPPYDAMLPLKFYSTNKRVPFRNDTDSFKRRVNLMQKLLIHLAPVLLKMVIISSGLLAATGGLYSIYTLAVWAFVSQIASGWLTISAILSLSATFMGISILGLSLGLLHLLNYKTQNKFQNRANEVNSVNIYGKIISELNVNLETDINDGVKGNDK